MTEARTLNPEPLDAEHAGAVDWQKLPVAPSSNVCNEKDNAMESDGGLIGAIDPGTAESGWVIYQASAPPGLIIAKGVTANSVLRLCVRGGEFAHCQAVVIEEIQDSHGMPAGREMFKTVRVSGWFEEALDSRGIDVILLPRAKVKVHLCNSMRAKDSNIRQALIDRFGPGKDKAIGGKRCRKCKGRGWFGAGRSSCPACQGSGWAHPPGALHGVVSHIWSALALAVTYVEQSNERGS